MIVGVLGLQGDAPEHRRAVASIVGEDHVRSVRSTEDLDAVDLLFLPGGESTTIGQLLQESGLWDRLAARLRDGLPVMATCAGLILLAREIEDPSNGRNPPTFGVLDVRVRRNDYGAQRESFEGPVEVDGLGGGPFPGIFIRAPRILAVGSRATAIARRGTEVVGVRSGSVWGLTFHPELSGDRRLHELFLEAHRTA